MADVARFYNRYPNIELTYEMEDAGKIKQGNQFNLSVSVAN